MAAEGLIIVNNQHRKIIIGQLKVIKIYQLRLYKLRLRICMGMLSCNLRNEILMQRLTFADFVIKHIRK